MSQKDDQKKPLNSYARYSGLAIQMLAIIGVGTFIGIKVDEKFPNKHKLFTLVASLSSVIIAIFVVIRTIVSTSKEKNK
ncbi:MAG: hypothetical protein ABS28_03675 [Cryomorphaceae bacterium BACL22 MAG-120619-bin32]|jgi:F0F1-type ATP synthase assembly protein I|nr:MAG: hypothetical protein ABS28_03675 [Cryomorphaceae bacterium BACL22 MAG-120619-bin32]